MSEGNSQVVVVSVCDVVLTKDSSEVVLSAMHDSNRQSVDILLCYVCG